MNVRFEDMGEGDVLFTRQVDVNVDIRSRIEYGCDAFFIVADQIRNFGEAFRFNRLKNKCHNFSAGIISRGILRTSPTRFPQESESHGNSKTPRRVRGSGANFGIRYLISLARRRTMVANGQAETTTIAAKAIPSTKKSRCIS